MTNIEKIIADGKIGLFKEMQKGDSVAFCNYFGIPMQPDNSYDLEKWMLEEHEEELITEIKAFISTFTTYGQDVKNWFIREGCYWFAHILAERFFNTNEKPIIMYIPTMNHFVVNIKDRLYDVTGDVTDIYNCGTRKPILWKLYREVNPDEAEKVTDKYIKLKKEE